MLLDTKPLLAFLLHPFPAHRFAEVVEDRRAAIAQAVVEASARDVVVIAGKGHEDYQEIAGVRHPFSDVTEATQALMQRGAL